MPEETTTSADQTLGDVAKTSYDQGLEKAQKWEQGVEASIRRSPVRAVLVAAGAGFLLSLLWFRK